MSPLSSQELLDSRAFAVEHPRSILFVPKEGRNDLLRAIIGDLGLRHALLLCHRKDRIYFPWSVYLPGRVQPHKLHDFVERYILLGPRIPLLATYKELRRLPWLAEGIDLVVADAGETLHWSSSHVKPLFATHGPRQIMFTSNALGNPRVLYNHLKWNDPKLKLFGGYKKLRDDHMIRIPSKSGRDGMSRMGVGYRNVDVMIEKLNTIFFPPFTRTHMWEGIKAWIGSRRPGVNRDISEEEFAQLKIPRMD